MNKLKIVGIIGEILSGSKYHRVKLPLNALNGKVVKIGEEEKEIEVSYHYSNDLTEELFIENDIIYVNWNFSNPIAWVSEMAEKHNTKLIHDIDDYWKLPKKHVLSKIAHYEQVPLIAGIVDLLITSNERLAYHLSKINQHISISHNDLPIGNGQFTPTELVKKEGKIAIGVCGSPSHLHDYQSIKWNLEKIAKDKELKEKCKFVICGFVPEDKIWEKILGLFTYEGFEVEVYTHADVDNYMILYKNIDILLAPLSPSEFAECKSSLKIMEASIYGIPVIASKEYESKEFNNCLIVRKSSDYYNLVKESVKDNQYITLGNELAKNNLSLNNFEGRINNLKQAIEYILGQKEVIPENLKVYSIIYDKDQYAEYECYDNSNIRTIEQKSYLFEYNPIIDIIDNKISDLKDDDYLGILSYKYSKKMGIPKRLFYKLFNELQASSPDIINISRLKIYENYLIWTEKQHPGFLEMFIYLCGKLNLDVNKAIHPIHSNYFLAKKSVYIDFVNNIIKPAIELMENDEFLKEKVWKDSNYSGLDKEKLKELTGLDHYTFHTFVLERLMSVYIGNHKELSFKSL